MKELDLPQSYVQKGETIQPRLHTNTIQQDAILDLLRSIGNSLWAEQSGGEGRRGVPIQKSGWRNWTCLGARSRRVKQLFLFCTYILYITGHLLTWLEARGAAWWPSNEAIPFVGGYTPPIVGVKKLDLPRS